METDLKPKKILFVVPSHDGEVREQITYKFYKNPVVKYMPLGVLSLASRLKNHDISVIDASSRGLSIDETIEEIEKVKPDILGISAVTYRAWAVREILEKTSCPIKAVGGPHTTANYNIILQQGAEAVFVGDSEETFVRWLKQGCPKGIFFGQAQDLNKLPLPARELVDLRDYIIKPNKDLLFNVGSLRLPMFSSKGCPFRCIFCDVQEKTFNWKTPEKVLEEFLSIINLGATSIHILDDCFNVNKERVIGICGLLMKNNISIDWSARGAVEVREDIIKALAEAGCKRLHVGIEHLDDEVLRFFRKSHSFKQIEKFCLLCNKYGIQIVAYFIIGAPGETRGYREGLPKRIENLGITTPYFNVLAPLHNTLYYRELLVNGILKSDFWDEFIKNPVRNFIMPSGRTKDLEKELKETAERYVNIFYSSDGERENAAVVSPMQKNAKDNGC